MGGQTWFSNIRVLHKHFKIMSLFIWESKRIKLGLFWIMWTVTSYPNICTFNGWCWYHWTGCTCLTPQRNVSQTGGRGFWGFDKRIPSGSWLPKFEKHYFSMFSLSSWFSRGRQGNRTSPPRRTFGKTLLHFWFPQLRGKGCYWHRGMWQTSCSAQGGPSQQWEIGPSGVRNLLQVYIIVSCCYCSFYKIELILL